MTMYLWLQGVQPERWSQTDRDVTCDGIMGLLQRVTELCSPYGWSVAVEPECCQQLLIWLHRQKMLYHPPVVHDLVAAAARSTAKSIVDGDKWYNRVKNVLFADPLLFKHRSNISRRRRL